VPMIIKIGAMKNSCLHQVIYLSNIFDDLDEIQHLKNSKTEQNAEESVYACTFQDSIEFKNICLRYPNRHQNSLSNINIKINKGEKIGIIGKSGAGKSTFLDILLGVLQPTSGTVLIDGKEININHWKHYISYVPQHIAMLSDTITKNIAFGVEKNINIEKIQDIIKIVGLSEVINNLPDKLNTHIGFHGSSFSGGQKQRLGIARALYFERDVLILDEATSALDLNTEKEISDKINQLQSSKTLIIAAHRLSTLKNCDKIIYLQHGIIVDVGSFDELAKHEEVADMLKLYDLNN
jgi:ABC-type bacteriocin/lantibiotic exporter with double-glycine peptidase domain